MWFHRKPQTKEKRIEKLLREHERLHSEYQFSSDFFIGHLRGPRVRADLSNRMAQIQAKVEELEADD